MWRENDVQPMILTSTNINVTSGPFKGFQGVISRPYKPFRFMDLPVELRTIIYELLLVEEELVSIVPRKSRRKGRRHVQSRLHIAPAHSGLRWDKKTWDTEKGRWADAAIGCLALAQTNKQIAQEVLPVVYGQNTFGFESTGGMLSFLDTIGSSRQFLRHVELYRDLRYEGGCGPKVFNSLNTAMNLRSFGICHLNICSRQGRKRGSCTLKQFLSDALPFLRMLHDSLQKRLDVDITVLDVVKILSSVEYCDPCEDGSRACVKTTHEKYSHTCKISCPGADEDRHCQEVEAEFKKTLAKELGIAAEEDVNGTAFMTM
jgi:hypothetical protein